MKPPYESIIEQAKDVWKDLTKNHADDTNIKMYDENSLNVLAQNAHAVIAIISLKEHRKLFHSNNAREMFGYIAEDDPILGVLQYVKYMALEHALFPLTAGRWYLNCMKSVPYEEKINQQIVFVGAKFTTTWGKKVQTFIQTSHLEEDEQRNPISIINSIHDISHLMKDNFWWCRYTYGDTPQQVKYYHSEFGGKNEGDILSDREKDILRLAHQGLDSPDIADKLCISLATVQTHRRNMLARTGMKDITALLQIALQISMI